MTINSIRPHSNNNKLGNWEKKAGAGQETNTYFVVNYGVIY